MYLQLKALLSLLVGLARHLVEHLQVVIEVVHVRRRQRVHHGPWGDFSPVFLVPAPASTRSGDPLSGPTSTTAIAFAAALALPVPSVSVSVPVTVAPVAVAFLSRVSGRAVVHLALIRKRELPQLQQQLLDFLHARGVNVLAFIYACMSVYVRCTCMCVTACRKRA